MDSRRVCVCAIRPMYSAAERASGLTCAQAKGAGYTLEEIKAGNFGKGLKRGRPTPTAATR